MRDMIGSFVEFHEATSEREQKAIERFRAKNYGANDVREVEAFLKNAQRLSMTDLETEILKVYQKFPKSSKSIDTATLRKVRSEYDADMSNESAVEFLEDAWNSLPEEIKEASETSGGVHDGTYEGHKFNKYVSASKKKNVDTVVLHVKRDEEDTPLYATVTRGVDNSDTIAEYSVELFEEAKERFIEEAEELFTS